VSYARAPHLFRNLGAKFGDEIGKSARIRAADGLSGAYLDADGDGDSTW
jgi:hypothetical protein